MSTDDKDKSDDADDADDAESEKSLDEILEALGIKVQPPDGKAVVIVPVGTGNVKRDSKP
jgi:hypothetical protein